MAPHEEEEAVGLLVVDVDEARVAVAHMLAILALQVSLNIVGKAFIHLEFSINITVKPMFRRWE